MKNPCSQATVVLLITACMLGCSKDSGTGPGPGGPSGTVQGRVTEMQSGEAMPDLRMLLVESATLAASRGPVMTDQEGFYAFTGIEAGEYLVFLFHNSHVTFDRNASAVLVGEGQTVTQDIRLTDSELWGSSRYNIEGIVTDAATGAPIGGAHVATTGSAHGGWDVFGLLAGGGMPSYGVTDMRGHFSVQTGAFVNEAGEALGLWPISIVKDGYRAASLVGTNPVPPGADLEIGALLPMPSEGDSVLTVSVQLVPIADSQPEEFGSLSGRLVHLGSPVAGIDATVSLFLVAEPDTLHDPTGKVLVPGRVATTDEEGRFLISNLDPGIYSLTAGFRRGDGYSGTRDLFEWPYGQYVVSAGDTTSAGDVEILKEITTVSPADGSVISDPLPLLEWAPVSGAIAYELQWRIDGYIMEHQLYGLSEPAYQIPAEHEVPAGSCVRWMVVAYGLYPTEQDTVEIARTEWAHTFCVRQ